MKDLTNKKFNMLTVIEFLGKDKNKKPLWKCKCECGNYHNIQGERLTSKTRPTRSCGCLTKKAITKHNKCGTNTYNAWSSMVQRTTNIKNNRYKDYMGRGIKICDKWLTFKGFYEDMGDRPEGTSLDRINNDGNYCKENCRLATRKEQQNNTRKNVYLTYKGKTQTIIQWSESLGISDGVIRARLYKSKWSLEKTLTTKPLNHKEIGYFTANKRKNSSLFMR